jgi:hypothetical protein
MGHDMQTVISREPFGLWLLAQRGRKGWIGDLADMPRRDPAFPKRGSPEEVRDRMEKCGAEPDMLEAVDDAELDYLAH